MKVCHSSHGLNNKLQFCYPGGYIKTQKRKTKKILSHKIVRFREDFLRFPGKFPVFGVVTLLPGHGLSNELKVWYSSHQSRNLWPKNELLVCYSGQSLNNESFDKKKLKPWPECKLAYYCIVLGPSAKMRASKLKKRESFF